MKLCISIIDINGKTFATDGDSGLGYCMESWEKPWREAKETDFYPMNRQGVIFDPNVYNRRIFSTLREAGDFVVKMTLEHKVICDEAELFDLKKDYDAACSPKLAELIYQNERLLSRHKSELQKYLG